MSGKIISRVRERQAKVYEIRLREIEAEVRQDLLRCRIQALAALSGDFVREQELVRTPWWKFWRQP